MSESSESEVLAQALDNVGSKLLAFETRLDESRESNPRARGSRSDYRSRVGGGFLALGPGVQSDAPSRVRAHNRGCAPGESTERSMR
jgi:hypothetical protein